VLMAVRHADTVGREETCQPPFSAPPPIPFLFGQQHFRSDRKRALMAALFDWAISLLSVGWTTREL
jgi:hypothetical protein